MAAEWRPTPPRDKPNSAAWWRWCRRSLGALIQNGAASGREGRRALIRFRSRLPPQRFHRKHFGKPMDPPKLRMHRIIMTQYRMSEKSGLAMVCMQLVFVGCQLAVDRR